MMKKIALVLAVLLFTAPAMAALSVSCSESSGTVTVSYDDAGGIKARAFALEVQLSGDGTITSLPGGNSADDYYIYPGGITISGGVVTNWGSPVAASDANSMIIEMGSLYATNDTDHPSAPANSGNLFSFGVSGTTTVTITLNNARGGVVMENGSAHGLGTPVCTCSTGPGDCLKSSDPGYTLWSTTFGKPNCWCYRKQCYGDGNGAPEFFKPVLLTDLNILKAGYNKANADLVTSSYGAVPGVCGDFNHTQEFFKSVLLGDLNILKSYYNLADSLVPTCSGANINYWTN